LDYQRLGPFQIIAQVNPINYRLELPPTMYIRPVFHVSLLEPYRQFQIPSRIPPTPPPIEIDHDVEYGVEEILDSCLRHCCLECFIHWNGYGIRERTWEPSSNCKNVLDKIWKFHYQYTSKLGAIG
jgi:hypothetical protein